MALKKVDKIWIDGTLVAWDDATEHVLAHTLHYGLAAFEGIRAYELADGKSAVFRLDEHLDRLFESCHICTIEVPYSRADLKQACLEVLRANKLKSAYLRPIVYLGYGALGLGTLEAPVRTAVAAFEWGSYLGDEGLRKGIRCKVSGFRRGNIDSMMSKGKISGQYVTSVLANRDAVKCGFDEAIMLDAAGLVAEGSGENIFVVKHGVVYTPPLSASILAGITRDSVITIARDLGQEVREENITRDQLWIADEVFMTGTAAEVTPVREIDFRKIGSGEPGPVTRRLQDHFFAAVKGKDDQRRNWLTPV
ncbi:MAG TPA: branched-chain amino acid transaminase [Kofleriaceae bacterium]|jgi:branched-chain amino acid aminotransferase|nr:branched-chain amino acid transaminase [Kofleriaceae bacterium]